jgi:MoaA/NifB/PqqE/SkfB family radical SAM enzyme
MMEFPEVVTFRITSKCNYNCKYCFSPTNIKELEIPELKKIFELFNKKNVKAVVLTGGEPLIREDIEQIFSELKEYSFKIFLDTNGSLFFRYKDSIDKDIDILALPLDFVNFSYRDKNHFNTIIKILKYYQNKEKRPKIRIGTVVTKDNFKGLEEIGGLLKDYPIDMWKIYEFLPQNINAVKNKASLEISPQEFEEATRGLKTDFSNFFKVVISKRRDRNRAYFHINPNGAVSIPVDNSEGICKERNIGNIFDKNIVEKWIRSVSKDNYIRNVKETFDYKFQK